MLGSKFLFRRTDIAFSVAKVHFVRRHFRLHTSLTRGVDAYEGPIRSPVVLRASCPFSNGRRSGAVLDKARPMTHIHSSVSRAITEASHNGLRVLSIRHFRVMLSSTVIFPYRLTVELRSAHWPVSAVLCMDQSMPCVERVAVISMAHHDFQRKGMTSTLC